MTDPNKQSTRRSEPESKQGGWLLLFLAGMSAASALAFVYLGIQRGVPAAWIAAVISVLTSLILVLGAIRLRATRPGA